MVSRALKAGSLALVMSAGTIAIEKADGGWNFSLACSPRNGSFVADTTEVDTLPPPPPPDTTPAPPPDTTPAPPPDTIPQTLAPPNFYTVDPRSDDGPGE